jgi:site-specific DNA-cytosine methylase
MNPFDHELGQTQSVCHQGGVMQVNDNDLLKMRNTFDNGKNGVRCLTPTHPQTHRVYDESGAFPSLCHNGGAAGQNQQAILAMRYIVRRLTPTECERLMGLPDGWTIPTNIKVTDELVEEFRKVHDTFNTIMAEYEGAKPPKPKTANQVRKWLEKIANPDTCPDSPRYKGCGNGWATNQPRWILTRLLAVEGVEWSLHH